MRNSVASFAALTLIVAGAAAIRVVCLDNRPMHTDEAVHGVKFGALLEDGSYEYDPHEYHGPALNYMTLPVVRMGGGDSIAQTTEVQLRLVPAICGILLIAGLWLIRDAIGSAAMLCAGVLCAASPAMIFYSRYYIQEMLLVCFTFFAIAALWRCSRRQGLGRCFWLLVAGLMMGLMHAAKETCVIAMFAMFVGGAIALVPRLRSAGGLTRDTFRRMAIYGGVLLVAGAVVSAIMFSSLFSNPGGIADSITTYGQYFFRAGGKGSAGVHSPPWHNYLHRIVWWVGSGGTVWTEVFIVSLSLIGLVAGLIGRGCGKASVQFVRFLAIYTVIMTLVYSSLSYKTPWCLLGFLHGMILLAGVGAAILLRIARPAWLKATVAIVLAGGVGHLGWLGWKANFPDCADPGNPYVYSHTTYDVPEMVRTIEDFARFYEEQGGGNKRTQMPMRIVCADNHAWPFPWYLRQYARVDWYGVSKEAPMVLIYPSDQENKFVLQMLNWPTLTPIKRPARDGVEGADFWEQRPNVRINMLINKKLWLKYKPPKTGAPN